MLPIRRGILGLVVLTALGALGAGRPAAAADKPDIYPLSKVKRGQKGYGMTTFAGTTPERFEFEVVGVAKNFLPGLDIILVKSDDPKLQVTGFWAGMSGSPLYIDGKLVCAFSYGWAFSKVPFGGCTPIEAMIEEGGTPVRGSADVVRRGNGKKKGKASASAGTLPTQVATFDDWSRLTPSSDVGEAFERLAPPRQPWLMSGPLPSAPTTPTPVKNEAGDLDEVMSASVPLAVAGFSSPAFAEIESMFGSFGVEPVRAGGTGGASAEGPSAFTMGGSISVQLIRGDMSAAATGTVSYIDGDRVLAFGHPMFQTGETYAPVATAEVLGVVPSAARPHVQAQPINEIGALVHDRQSMIMADTSLRHPMIPVDMYVHTRDGKGGKRTTREFHVEIWNNRYFTGRLAGAAAMNAIGTFLPDQDHATAKIVSTLKIKGTEPFTFTDYLYAADGASSLIAGARGLRAIVPILLNPWAPVQVEGLSIDVDLSFDTNYGDIKEIRVPKVELEPGKSYELEVVLETFGNKDVVDKVPFTVPRSLAGQIVTVEVTAGDAAKLDAAPAVDLDSLYAAIRKLLPGNVYAVSVYAADEGVAVGGIAVKDLPPSAQDKLRPQTSSQRALPYRPIARTTSPAPRVINGAASLTVRIADVER